jgi:hypothetical protein
MQNWHTDGPLRNLEHFLLSLGQQNSAGSTRLCCNLKETRRYISQMVSLGNFAYMSGWINILVPVRFDNPE